TKRASIRVPLFEPARPSAAILAGEYYDLLRPLWTAIFLLDVEVPIRPGAEAFDEEIDEAAHLRRQELSAWINCKHRELVRLPARKNAYQPSLPQRLVHEKRRLVDHPQSFDGGIEQCFAAVASQVSRDPYRSLDAISPEAPVVAEARVRVEQA